MATAKSLRRAKNILTKDISPTRRRRAKSRTDESGTIAALKRGWRKFGEMAEKEK